MTKKPGKPAKRSCACSRSSAGPRSSTTSRTATAATWPSGITDEAGNEWIVITATGSQKGDLEPSQICFLSPDRDRFRLLQGLLRDRYPCPDPQPPRRAGFDARPYQGPDRSSRSTTRPSPTGRAALFRSTRWATTTWAASFRSTGWPFPAARPRWPGPSPSAWPHHPATVIQAHGTFAQGGSLKEAFFLICVANNAGAVVRLETARRRCRGAEGGTSRPRPRPPFSYPPPGFTIDGDDVCDFPEETEILREFEKAGARVFESRLSPFHTGSMSVRGVNSMLYAPKASMPREVGGPLLELPLDIRGADDAELRVHKEIYARERLPDAHALLYSRGRGAWPSLSIPGESEPLTGSSRSTPRGVSSISPSPSSRRRPTVSEIVRLLQDYKVVIVRGAAFGRAAVSRCLRCFTIPRRVREICLYRIGAYELGLDVPQNGAR